MSERRKPFEAREKDLRLALLRIKRGRAKTSGDKLSIASVAREAGISAALIHNHYPAVADAVRLELHRNSRKHGNRMHEKLKHERNRGRVLRAEIVDLRAQIARLATINEVLRFENESFRAKRVDAAALLSSPRAIPRVPSNRIAANQIEESGSASIGTGNALRPPAR